MIAKQELARGIRFAGERAATAARYCRNWEHQLAHQWTSGDAFRHVANSADGLARLYPLLDAGALSAISPAAVAQMNAQAVASLAGQSREEIARAIVEGHRASAAFVEGLAEDDLAKVVTLGGYEMPKGEILAQIWIHHAIAHAYEASARWPIA
ncbi:MAG: maleylpyruvate isomerase N-terminal domain-containing protein [Dehalococcoidia bacterium]|nr:maleylpyruvate isomerase N-terminal domain-containing protein [Dehalococcoidia bacterium]